MVQEENSQKFEEFWEEFQQVYFSEEETLDDIKANHQILNNLVSQNNGL